MRIGGTPPFLLSIYQRPPLDQTAAYMMTKKVAGASQRQCIIDAVLDYSVKKIVQSSVGTFLLFADAEFEQNNQVVNGAR